MITNNKFGRLQVIKEVEPIVSPCGTKRRKFLCQCDCGNQKEVQFGHLKSGHTQSCGCFHKETFNNKKHGLKYHPIYHTWTDMKQRCLNNKNSRYNDYGGRGIIVCDSWLGKNGFVNFLNDMGERPIGKSLDRIDNDGNYCKENCRWATISEQNKNQRRWKVA